MGNARFNTLAAIGTAGLLLGLGVPTFVSADQPPAAAPRGCTFLAASNIELQIFDDIANGDEGDFIGSFKLATGERSEEIIPQNKPGVLWYKYRYRYSTRWYAKNRIKCAPGAVVRVPG